MPENSPHRIIIIEDERAITKALQLKLTKEGFDVASVSNGQDGVNLMLKEKFDLVLLDLMMPQMDGFMTLAEFHKNSILTPVIVLSNLSQAEDEQKAKGLGAKEFFVKSNVSIADLVQHVKEVLLQ